jgi:hypothetical protein
VSEPLGLTISSKSPITSARSATEQLSVGKSSATESTKHAPGVIRSLEDIERLAASRTLAVVERRQ